LGHLQKLLIRLPQVSRLEVVATPLERRDRRDFAVSRCTSVNA
jgi:hypothetical protein